MYPNLGELRSVRWNVVSTERDGNDMVSRLAAFGPISSVHAEKTVTLSGSSPVVKVQYEVTNLGPAGMDFIWGTHPALAPTPHMVLRIPARMGIVGLSKSIALAMARFHVRSNCVSPFAWSRLIGTIPVDTPEAKARVRSGSDDCGPSRLISELVSESTTTERCDRVF